MDYSELYRKEIGRTKFLTSQEQIQLVIKAQQGNEKSKQKLIKTNLKFILDICLNFKCKHNKTSDLVNEGVIGICRAINTFDINKNVKFLTYAGWWIRLYIQIAIAKKDNLIYVPPDIIERIKKENQQHNNENELSIDVYKYMKMVEFGVSYDALISNSGLTLSEILADEKSPSPEHAIKDKQIKNKLLINFLGILTDTEKYVIEHLFGINGKKETTITNLYKKSKISVNAIKVLYSQAIERMRTISNFRTCKDLYEDFNDTYKE